MKRKKITVVGAGNVGATTAFMAAQKELGDIVLIDIVKGLAEGKALDMSQASGLCGYDCKVTGTTNWTITGGSDVVIITSGLARKPGMSRDDLLAKNTEIVKSVTEQVVKFSPESFIVVVCNPLDAMVNAAAMVSGFEKNKIMGMAGALDTARFAFFISEKLSVSVKDIRCVLMGGHGDDMVPLPRFTTVSGIPLPELLDEKTVEEIVQRTRMGGIEIVNYLKTGSAFYAPAASAVEMIEAIVKDRKRIIPCTTLLEGQYGIDNVFCGVPIKLGKNGVEQILEINLSGAELEALQQSAAIVEENCKSLAALLA